MATDARIPMPTDSGDAAPGLAAHLQFAQWVSPAFPISAFAYSHGLEAEIAAGRVTDADSLLAWVTVVLEQGTGRSDAILMLAARRGDAPEADLADLALALCGSAERRQETLAQGTAFGDTHAALAGAAGADPWPYPVALGCASRALDLPDEVATALFLQAFAGNLVSAAVRFMPLGQVEGQRVAKALHPVIAAVARDVQDKGLDDLGQSAFGAELAAMEHEDLEVRIFRT